MIVTTVEDATPHSVTEIVDAINGQTLITDLSSGEITFVENTNAPSTIVETVTHAVTEVDSNAVLIVNNATALADRYASDANYLYFGFDYADWRIRRVVRNGGLASIARESSNLAYADLNAAWAQRETLAYS